MKSEKSEGRIWKTNESRFEVAIFEVMSKWKLLSVNDCESRISTYHDGSFKLVLSLVRFVNMLADCVTSLE